MEKQPIQLDFNEAQTALQEVFSATIGNLTLQNAMLKKQLAANIETVQLLNDHIKTLEAELTETVSIVDPHVLSSEAAEIAAQGDAIIANEKAAPTEAA